MRKPVVLILALVALTATSVLGGEPLVVKTQAGKFIPAVANEWAPAGQGAFRFVLKAGSKAQDIASELKDRIAPVTVEATDDLTLLFRGKNLTEQALLDTLAGLPLGKDKAVGDALAALSDLGDSGGPALSDLSSAGSIRASKKFELPKSADRKSDPHNVIGQVVKIEPCTPMPTLVIKVTAAPTQGKHRGAFAKGQEVAVRGYYKAVSNDDPALDPNDERTQINLKTKALKRGARVFGKPFIKDNDVWVLETIEKL